MGKLDGRVAIVAGASRGIGRDIAVSLAREGARVVVAARTEKPEDSRIPGNITMVAEQIRAAGGQAMPFRCDVTNDEQIEACVQKTLETWGRVDILVNNAAVLVPGTIMEMQARHWDLMYRILLRGPFIFCRAVLPHMVKQGWGHIVNISSSGSIGPGPGPYKERGEGGTTYGVTKAGLERLSQGLAHELWGMNIAVNVLSPAKGILSEGQRYFRDMAGAASGLPPDISGIRESGEIMGDATVVICSKDPGSFTGNILYDEDVLKKEGIDLAKYPVNP